MLKLENVWMQVTNENGQIMDILKGLDIEFEKGKVYAVTGPNGGGKTSLAKVIMGIYQHSRGNIYLDDELISDCTITERARKGICYAFQQPPRFKGLTIHDMLRIAGPAADPQTIREYMQDVGLCPDDYLDRDLGIGLSGGEIKRIEIAQVLLRNPKISIFDEPEAGVDLWTIQKLLGLIISAYKNNPSKTAIVITHNERIIPLCDEIVIIEDGKVTAQGLPADIWHPIQGVIEDIACHQDQDDPVYGVG
ncbi:MAG TPA: ATP-binding cassette domain-containing protein [Syntrophomonadaceae bacterium]|nr:ATP-binding cassette domain-containing protein [Syntrophomonadaceae bacterium]